MWPKLNTMKHFVALAALLTTFSAFAQLQHDSNNDGCVGSEDLLSLLTEYGSCEQTFVACGDELEYQGHYYRTVEIGGQCWFAENLRSTFYANGDPISGPSHTDVDWQNATEGAFTSYGDPAASQCVDYSSFIDACTEEVSIEEWGFLYNGYAVRDGRGICPAGWHVPAVEEFNELHDFAGIPDVDGVISLRDSTWTYNPGIDALGFGLKPAGARQIYPNNGNAFLWSSSEVESDRNAYFNHLSTPALVSQLNHWPLSSGLSVRCLRNE